MSDDNRVKAQDRPQEKQSDKSQDNTLTDNIGTAPVGGKHGAGPLNFLIPKNDDNTALTKQEKDAISRYEYNKDQQQYDAAKIAEVNKMTPEQQKAFADRLLDQELHRKVDSGDGSTGRPGPGQGDTPPQTSKPGDAPPSNKTPDGKGVDANFDEWVKRQHEDKNNPQSAHQILEAMKESGHVPTKEQVDEVYKVTGEERFRKIDELVDDPKNKGRAPQELFGELAKNPELLTRENIDRLYRDGHRTPPEVANDGKSITSIKVDGINGRVNVSKEELQEYEKMQELQMQYDAALRSGNATLAQGVNTQLTEATRQFFTDAGQHNNPQIGGRSPEYSHEEQRRMQALDQDRRALEAQMAHPGAGLPKDQAEAKLHGAQGVGADGNPTPQFCRELKQLQDTNPALYQAELQGATQKLIEMGVIPEEHYRYKPGSNENVARVEGVSTDDHPGFVIANGETNHPGEAPYVYVYKDGTFWGGYAKDQEDRNKGWMQIPHDDTLAMNPIDSQQFRRDVDRKSYAVFVEERVDATGHPLPPEQQ